MIDAYDAIVEALNATPGHEIDTLREAGKALQRLGRICHLTGRDWNTYADLVDEIEQELIDRSIEYNREDQP